MDIYTNLDDLPRLEKPFLTMGGFDGVHLGHQAILKQIITKARKNNGTSCLLTFEPHPRFVLHKHSDLKLITDIEEKSQKLERLGLDVLFIIPFTTQLSRLSSLEFVRNILVEKINIYQLVVGYDHQFGKNREGNFDRLAEYSEMFGFELEQLEAVKISDVEISSTKIRKSILEGNLEYVETALGNPFQIMGKVVKGNQLGRQLGFPTANLQIDPHQIIPKDGVYWVEVLYNGSLFDGMMNIGVRPSIKLENQEKTVEVHLFNFVESIYSETIRVFVKKRIRDEIKFSTTQELTSQLIRDKAKVLMLKNKN